MSRIGRKIVALPKGVALNVGKTDISVKGPKGELKRAVPTGVSIKVNGQEAQVERADDSRENRAKHGMMRALLANMVKGVSDGWERQLEINGVGYRAEVKGSMVLLTLGFSHPIEYKLPEGVSAKVDKNLLILSGMNKQHLGAAAAKIRSFRGPEPYKGKGVKYVEETILRKAGKAAGKGK